MARLRPVRIHIHAGTRMHVSTTSCDRRGKRMGQCLLRAIPSKYPCVPTSAPILSWSPMNALGGASSQGCRSGVGSLAEVPRNVWLKGLVCLAPRSIFFRVRRAALDKGQLRSEERRVGKECGSTCRSRCAPLHSKKIEKRIKSKDHTKD